MNKTEILTNAKGLMERGLNLAAVNYLKQNGLSEADLATIPTTPKEEKVTVTIQDSEKEEFFAMIYAKHDEYVASGRQDLADQLAKQYKLRFAADVNKLFGSKCRRFGCETIITGTRAEIAGVNYCIDHDEPQGLDVTGQLNRVLHILEHVAKDLTKPQKDQIRKLINKR